MRLRLTDCATVTTSRQLHPFTIAVPDEVLDDLRSRLAGTRWPDQIPGIGWDSGTDLMTVRELCEYWRDGYDWRLAEAELNSWPGMVPLVRDHV